MTTFALRLGLVTAISISLGGCTGGLWMMRPGCLVELVPSAELPRPLALRARARFEVRGQAIGLEIVARADGEGLVVVGLTPYGVRLFAARQTDRALEIDAASGRVRALARFALDALHRALWVEPPGTGPSQAGASWRWGDEQVSVSRVDGRVQREFSRGGRSKPVVIEYPPRFDHGRPAHAAVESGGQGDISIRNPRCGYDAIMVLLAAGRDG